MNQSLSAVFRPVRARKCHLVAFYVTCDTAPARWFGRDADGHPHRHDDLPEPYRANIAQGMPFKPFADDRR